MRSRQPNRDPFHELSPARVPAELRPRVLRAARRAAQDSENPDIWSRLLEGRRARLAWSVAIFALLFANVLVGIGPWNGRGRPAATGIEPPAQASRPPLRSPTLMASRVEPELAEEVSLHELARPRSTRRLPDIDEMSAFP